MTNSTPDAPEIPGDQAGSVTNGTASDAAQESFPGGLGLLEQAVLALAGVCDGANSHDGQGFNARDVAFFRPHVETAQAGGTIAVPLRRRVLTRLQKYGTQLFALGINLNDVIGEEQGSQPDGSTGTSVSDGDDVPASALADSIRSEQAHFAQDAGGKLFVYQDGVYRPGGEEFVRRRVKAILEDWNLAHEWSKHLGNEVVEYIRVDSPQLWERPPADVVNVINGLLNVDGRELIPHTTAFLSPIRIPVTFDPDAECPAIDRFIGEVFPQDGLDLPYELAGTLLIPGEGQEKAILLLGAGGNGKSAFLTMLRRFVGKGNTASVPLHKLEADRFSSSRLVGKLANICPDLPSQDLSGTSTFKSITGKDTMTAEYKYRDSFEYDPFARLIFSANSPPRSSDSSEGFFDRWVVVPFAGTFRGTDQEIPREELDALLSEPGQLSGLLNSALDGWQRFRDNNRRYSVSFSMEEAFNEFANTIDPVAIWLSSNIEMNAESFVPKSDLFQRYNDAAVLAGNPMLTSTAFGRAVRRFLPELAEAQRTVGGIPGRWVWMGLRPRSLHAREGIWTLED